jgi:hypothetical protein
MDTDREQAEIKALEALYLAYADEFEALERERDHIAFEYVGALDTEKTEELKTTISN